MGLCFLAQQLTTFGHVCQHCVIIVATNFLVRLTTHAEQVSRKEGMEGSETKIQTVELDGLHRVFTATW